LVAAPSLGYAQLFKLERVRQFAMSPACNSAQTSWYLPDPPKLITRANDRNRAEGQASGRFSGKTLSRLRQWPVHAVHAWSLPVLARKDTSAIHGKTVTGDLALYDCGSVQVWWSSFEMSRNHQWSGHEGNEVARRNIQAGMRDVIAGRKGIRSASFYSRE
jgi:hypothetical protein